MTEGFSKEDAERLRTQGRQIVACFFCLHEGRPAPYFEFDQTHTVGAMIACPAHWDSHGFGLVKIGDWLGP